VSGWRLPGATSNRRFMTGERMPIYEYECLECGSHFELRQSVESTDALSPATCPAGHALVRRLLSRPTIIFKGSGFYVTDHGRNGKGKGSSQLP